MSAMDSVVSNLKTQLKKIGIEIADISIYSMTEFFNLGSKSNLIVVGYLPDKALIVTLDIIVNDTDGKIWSSTFKINFEVTNDKVYYNSYITEYIKGTQGLSIFVLHFETHKLDEGFEFIKKVLIITLAVLSPKFTESIFLWFVPEYSDEYKKLEAKYGKHDSRIKRTFNEKVFIKLPASMFSATQSE
jgi:hypothetical protein